MMVNETLKCNAKRSIIWSFVEKIGTQGMGFTVSIILSRLLLPCDYGTIALLSVFISIAQVIIDGGFSTALIQNQDRSEEDYCTAFYCNIIVSLLAYGILYLCAPMIASFYNQTDLIIILRIYSLSIVISSLAIIQKIYFIITYNFRIIAIVTTIAISVSGIISIILAYKGFGTWALVAYYILSSLMTTIGYWISSKWYPNKRFSVSSFKSIFNFGSKILFANIINVTFSNIYTLVIGRQFSSVQLGYFNRSQTIANVIPSNISNILTQASYPIFCELQKDETQLRKIFLKYLQISFFLCAPIMTFLIAIASPLVIIVLTEKWADSIIYIQILAFGYMFDPIMRLNANVMNVTGHSDYTLNSELFKKVSLIAIMIVTVTFGIKALVWGVCIYSFIDLLIGSIYVKRIINVSFIDEFVSTLPIMFCCSIMYICMYIIQLLFENHYAQIVAATLIGFTSYYLSCLMILKNEIRFISDALNLRNK